MISLKLKESNSKVTLKEVTKKHPEVLDEIDELLSSVATTERVNMRATMDKIEDPAFSSMVASDRHYAVYETLRTPTNVKIDSGYIFGWKSEDIKEISRYIPLQEQTHLRQLYESVVGTDPLSSVTSAQAGIPLKKRQTESELRLIQLIVNSRYNVDPYCRNIVDNLTRYVIGQDFKFSVQAIEIEEVLEDFANQVDFGELIKDYFKTSMKDGEVGLALKSRVRKGAKKVDWIATKTFSEEVRAIEFNLEDGSKKYSYHKKFAVIDQNNVKTVDRWIADIDYFYQFSTRGNVLAFDGKKSENHGKLTEDEVMAWFQHGDGREVRGRVPLEPVLRDLRLFEDFRINRAILNYERSKVLYIKKLKAQIGRLNSSSEVRKSSSPKGGVQLTLGPMEEYEMKTANLHAADADNDGLLFLYAISTGISIPIYILGMRADQQNYSAIKNTDSPFIQMILDLAGDFKSSLTKVFKWVLYRNIQAGVLPKEMTIKRVAREKMDSWFATQMKIVNVIQEAVEQKRKIEDAVVQQIDTALDDAMEEVTISTLDMPIDIIIADAVKPNPLELAKVAFIERRLGIVSSQTLSEKRGYNWPVELRRMLEEARDRKSVV